MNTRLKRFSRGIGGLVEDYALPHVVRGLKGIRYLRNNFLRKKRKYDHVPESNQNLYLPEGMINQVSPEKKRRLNATPVMERTSIGTQAYPSRVSRRIVGAGSTAFSVVSARGKNKKRITRKLNLTSILFPMGKFATKGFGHDILTGESLKAVHWKAGFQDVRLAIMLPALFNYQGRTLDPQSGANPFK